MTAKAPLYKSLYAQVLAGIALGIVVGLVAPETGAAMRPLGDGFIKLIRLLIGPIVFTTIVVGLARVSHRRLSRCWLAWIDSCPRCAPSPT